MISAKHTERASGSLLSAMVVWSFWRGMSFIILLHSTQTAWQVYAVRWLSFTLNTPPHRFEPKSYFIRDPVIRRLLVPLFLVNQRSFAERFYL